MLRINYFEQFELEDSRPGTNGNHETLLSRHGSLERHWGWEFNVYKNNVWIGWRLSLKTRMDHQGIELSFAFLKHEFEFLVYDGRHWDYDNDCPEV